MRMFDPVALLDVLVRDSLASRIFDPSDPQAVAQADIVAEFGALTRRISATPGYEPLGLLLWSTYLGTVHCKGCERYLTRTVFGLGSVESLFRKMARVHPEIATSIDKAPADSDGYMVIGDGAPDDVREPDPTPFQSASADAFAAMMRDFGRSGENLPKLDNRRVVDAMCANLGKFLVGRNADETDRRQISAVVEYAKAVRDIDEGSLAVYMLSAFIYSISGGDMSIIMDQETTAGFLIQAIAVIVDEARRVGPRPSDN